MPVWVQLGSIWCVWGTRMVNKMFGPLHGLFQGARLRVSSRVQVDGIKFIHPEPSG